MKCLVRILRHLKIVNKTAYYGVFLQVNSPSHVLAKRLHWFSTDSNFYNSTHKHELKNVQESVSSILLKEKKSETEENSLSSNVACHEITRIEDSVSPGFKSLEKYNLGNFKVTSFPPTFNFAAYVNDSPSLQELVKLGVHLHEWEKKKGIMEFILQREFHRDMAPYVKFIHEVGVPAENLGRFLTMNPLIFKEDLDDLRVRINYLESKNFTPEMISRIVTTNPYWLMFSAQRIDRRLGHFQKTFQLSGQEIRQLVVTLAKLITYNMEQIKTITFVLQEELGLKKHELKNLLLKKPRLWVINQLRLKKRFEYVHLEMKIPHELILKNPEILVCREFRIKERHLFLKSLRRDQYDPTLPSYVSLKHLVEGTNAEFAVNVAKTSVDTFNMFLKTL